MRIIRVSRLTSVVTLLAIVVSMLMPLQRAAAQLVETPGVSLADMDPTIDPGVDFYRYANGGWLDRTTIPPDFASIETMSDLEGRMRGLLIQLLLDTSTSGTLVRGTPEWKAVRLFQQGVDLERRNALGLEPIQPVIDEIDAIDDEASLHRFLQGSVFKSVPGFFFVSAGPDMRDSSQTVAYLNGPWLGLPSRDFYVLDDPGIAAVQEGYRATAAQLLQLTGRDDAAATRSANAVFALEARLAAGTKTQQESVSFSTSSRSATIADLSAQLPQMEWQDYFAAVGLPDLAAVVELEPRYMASLAEILAKTELEVLKDYLLLQLLWTSSSNLDAHTESTAFAYYGGVLNGVSVQAPVEGRTLDQVNYFLGDAVGKLYVSDHFSANARAQSQALVEEIVAAFRVRLEQNTWMTPATKVRALEKLAKLRVKVGYPDQLETYEDVLIGPSYYASALSAFNALYRKGLATIGQPVDRSEWPFPAQTVNAMYNPLNNEIVVPAGILQPPLFSAEADAASNFGAIGYIIGHEITHGFDNEGAQFDGDGNLANWWTPQDHATFDALNQKLVEQYSEIAVGDLGHVDGQLTLAENVADLGGIQVAHDALQLHLATTTDERVAVDGLTPEQRFFIAAASVWRAESRDEALANSLRVNAHAPSMVRATQPLRNSDEFFAAFDIEPGDPMYLEPSSRVAIW